MAVAIGPMRLAELVPLACELAETQVRHASEVESAAGLWVASALAWLAKGPLALVAPALVAAWLLMRIWGYDPSAGEGTLAALSRIVFVSEVEGNKEIYLMDYDGQRIRRLSSSGTINLSPVWSPDG